MSGEEKLYYTIEYSIPPSRELHAVHRREDPTKEDLELTRAAARSHPDWLIHRVCRNRSLRVIQGATL